MRLSDFVELIRRRKKLLLISAGIAFLCMLLFTLLLNNISYEITATIRLDSSILLSSGTATQGEKTYNRVVLPMDKLDDRAAMEYVQQNKDFFSEPGMVDYNELIITLSDKSFINKNLNSVDFRVFLRESGIADAMDSVSMVEQTDSLSVRVHGEDKDRVLKNYNSLLEIMPAYVDDAVHEKLAETVSALEAAIDTDRAQADETIAQYAALKAKTGFDNAVDYNEGLELLNRLSALSHNVNQNAALANRLQTLSTNSLSPDMAIKNEDLSGLRLKNLLLPYLIIEFVAAVLLGLAIIFLTELVKSAGASAAKAHLTPAKYTQKGD